MQQNYCRPKGISEFTNMYIGSIDAAVDLPQFYVWTKPEWAKIVQFTLLGGGGGGAGGNTGALGGTAASSRGGGAGALSIITVSAIRLPGILYISPGYGGTGGASASAGNAGGKSRVSFRPTTNLEDQLIIANGGGGGVTTNNVISAAATTLSTASYCKFGLFASYAGAASISIDANPVYSKTTPINSSGTSGGQVTSGTAAAGYTLTLNTNAVDVGQYLLASLTNASLGVYVLGGTSPGGNGRNGASSIGFDNEIYWLSLGGTGGGARNANSGVGGTGGDGGPSSGGGAGGSATGSGATGGSGGKGGPGIILVSCW